MASTRRRKPATAVAVWKIPAATSALAPAMEFQLVEDPKSSKLMTSSAAISVVAARLAVNQGKDIYIYIDSFLFIQNSIFSLVIWV